MSELRICIAGMVGTGKTTVAKLVSESLGLPLISESQLGQQYLERLFNDPTRWGFEAQVAFLVDKAEAILSTTPSSGFVLDRSVEEDVSIFFEYFKELHGLDPLSARTYEKTHSLVCRVVPEPSMWVFCVADFDAVVARIHARGAFKDYVPGYLESVFHRYTRFLESKAGAPRSYIFDSQQFDIRKEKVAAGLRDDLRQVAAGDSESKPIFNVLRPHS